MFEEKKDVDKNFDNIITFNAQDANGSHDGLQKSNDVFAQVALECVKKDSKNLTSAEFAGEFLKTYNYLKSKANNSINQNIPEQTVFDDYIICLEDGKKMQMLKRHLKVHYNMSFQEYKKKWGLPIDYPCTCKKYSEIRANIAKKRNRKNII